MAKMTIVSRLHGPVTIILDDLDYARILDLGGKWTVVKKRGMFYFQKRMKSRAPGSMVELHRFIMNAQPGQYVDHISRDTLDNRRANLRICTNAANLRNGRLRPNNTSGVTGVSWNKGKWAAEIKVNYQKIYLGRFTSLEEAASVRAEAERRYFDI
jgi:hypothetical protein